MTEDLKRIRLQREILKDVPMLSAAEARRCLDLPDADATGAPELHAGQTLNFSVDGEPWYPAFQFDGANRRIYPITAILLETARRAGWSNFRLLNWILRPHLDFDCVPAEVLEKQGDAVLQAMLREVAPETHG